MGKIDCDPAKVDNSILEEFFERRFKRKPNPEDEYFKEWKGRFYGRPELSMDTQSKEVYFEVLRKAIWECVKLRGH